MLVDTGLENSEGFILQYVENRFGKDSKPEAIILTHGHFDHVGSVIKLSELWEHLEVLVNHFDEIAKPEQGRFINQ